MVPQEPEEPEDPEQVRQRPGVVGQVPAHGGGQVALLGLQALGPLALAGAAQRPVGLLGQRPVVLGVPPRGSRRRRAGPPAARPRTRGWSPASAAGGRRRLGRGWTRLWRASASNRSSASVLVQAGHLRRRPRRSSRPRTPPRSPAATARRPPAARRSTPPWPAGCVAARAGPPRPFPARPATWPAGASSASGSSSRVRAAASSIASGRPSSRRQISATAAALPSVRAKPGRTARARSTNSATAGDAASSASGTPAGSAGSGSGGTGYSRSARSPSTVRLVARITTPRTAGQQRVDVAGRVDHLLQVVEDQQPPVVAEVLDQGLQRRARPGQLDPHRPGDARQHQLGLGDRGQRDERDPAPKRSPAARPPPPPAGSCRPRPARSGSPAAPRPAPPRFAPAPGPGR